MFRNRPSSIIRALSWLSSVAVVLSKQALMYGCCLSMLCCCRYGGNPQQLEWGLSRSCPQKAALCTWKDSECREQQSIKSEFKKPQIFPSIPTGFCRYTLGEAFHEVWWQISASAWIEFGSQQTNVLQIQKVSKVQFEGGFV
jgi:hypothetical protein